MSSNYTDNEENQQDSSSSSYSTTNTGQRQSLSQNLSAFGLVQNSIAECLSKELTLKIAQLLKNFTPAMIDSIDQSGSASQELVKLSVKIGYITRSGADPVLEALERLNMHGLATDVRRLYEEHKEELKAEISSYEKDSSLEEAATNELSHRSTKRTLALSYSEETDASLEGADESLSTSSRDQKKRVKVPFKSFSDVTFLESYVVYILKIYNSPYSWVNKNKARCLGIAFDLSGDPPRPKMVYTTYTAGKLKSRVPTSFYKLKRGMHIYEKNCYNLMNCYDVTVGQQKAILIDPQVETSLISKTFFQMQGINFQDLEADESCSLIESSYSNEGINLPIYTVKQVKYDMPERQGVFIILGIVKEIFGKQYGNFPRTIFKLIDDTSGEYVDVSIPLKYMETSWWDVLQESKSVILRHFRTHRSVTYKSDTNMLIGTEDSSVELLESDRFDDLKEFDLGLSQEGVVIEVNPVRPYLACPMCNKKVDEDSYRCLTCKDVFSEEDLEKNFRVELKILFSPSKEIVEGVVFNDNVIAALRSYDKSKLADVTEDVHTLAALLIDKRIRVVVRHNEEGNDVFSKLKILGDAA